MLEIGPILRALMRNKVGAILIALQIAVTMTIIVNSVFIILERHSNMQRESGVDEANTFHFSSVGFADNFNPQVTITEDLDAIRNTPGVVAATQINAIPISGGGWSMGLQTEAGAEVDATGVAVYMVDETGIDALDLELIAGENFVPSDIRWRGRAASEWPDKVIITQAMAERLFPDIDYAQTVGKTVFINDNEPMIIIGIIDKLQAPWVGWQNVENAMLSPERLDSESARYLVRTEPGMRDELMPKIEDMLATSNRDRIIRNLQTLEENRERSYRGDNAMISILSTIMVILTIVTAMGIVGLASFSVNRRTKQIGTRRALGASKGDIVRYFMLENFLISSFGVILGALLTVGLNIVLVNAFELDPIDWYFIPMGMAILWFVGQAAVYGPARRASMITPATATRTV